MGSNDIFSNIMNYSSDKSKDKGDGVVENKEKKKMKKSEQMIENIRKQGFNMEQLEEVIKVRGNQLIISIAGSGKTTSLIFKIAYDITSGEATRVANVNGNDIRVLDKIWVCTFLKSGADELKSKLAMWQRKLGVMDTSDSMAFSTLHAEFKRALTNLGVSTNIIDSSVNSKNLKVVCDKYAIKDSNGKPLNSDEIRNLESALTYTRNRLDNQRYNRQIYKELDIGPTIIDAMLREWKLMRRELGCVDFEDLQEMLYDECYRKNNIEIINFLSKRYNYIYVDEFQDTSQIQYALLKVYANGCKKIVAIGDDDQTIYSWRGSYNKIITEEFAKDFNPTINSLNVNYRCPSVILNAVKPSLEKNVNRFKKELKSFNQGGVFRFVEYANYTNMVENLSDMIYEDVAKGMSVAVLCRVNSDGLLPALMLDKLGKFQFTISGDGMTLDSYIGKQVINIAKLFTERTTPAVKSTLSQLTWNKYSINNIMKVCKNNKVSFWQLSNDDLAHSCPDIYSTLRMWKDWRNQLGDIEALKMIYAYFRNTVYVNDTQYNTVCKSVISSIETLLSYTKARDVEDFLEDLENINERLKARKKKFNGSKVRIATVHEFKGKEADSVYVWNDSQDIFPHKECDFSNPEEVEEERRVHYIACTRARKINTVMCMKGRRGMFASEMDLSEAQMILPKMGGVLKGKKIDELESDKMLSDKNFFTEEEEIEFVYKPKDKVKKEIYTITDEEKKYILDMYRDGLIEEEIEHDLRSNGIDHISLEDIRDIVEEG